MLQRFTPPTRRPRPKVHRWLSACMVAILCAGLLPPPLVTSLFSATLPPSAAQTLAQATNALLPQPNVAEAASNVLSGHAYRDYNLNGSDDGAGEPGIANLVVTVYNDQGAACQTTTDAAGAYTVTVATCNGGALASGSDQLRVEFTRPSDGSLNFLQSSVAGGTTVQFVNLASGNVSNVDTGFNDPAQYTQPNPPLVTNRYVAGPQTLITATLVTFPYTAGCVDADRDGNCESGVIDAPAPTKVADANAVGPTWGLAYQRSTHTLFAAAFMKRHAGFRQQGKTGIIYKVQDPQGARTITTYLDLDGLGFDTGTDPHPANNAVSPAWEQDTNAWDAVGKVGLGDLDIAADDQTLWTINLFDRKLYKIPIKTPPVQSSEITTYTIPNPCSTIADFRPFATAFHDAKVYVGVTCTGESSAASYAGGQINAPNFAGDRSLLSAHVYSFDPQTATFTPQLTVPLTYPRKDAIASSAHLSPGAWNPWSPKFIAYRSESDPVNCATDRAYPQPWLTDIEFDNGNMILGIRDRFGDQTGYQQQAPSPFIVNDTPQCNGQDIGGLFNGVGVGDTLRACGNPTTGWTLESNGACGGSTTSGASNGDGVGGGEYYYQDDFAQFFHNDTGLGGLVQIPGYPDVVSTTFDPQNAFTTTYDGGIFWLNNSTGQRSRAYRVFDTASLFPDPFDPGSLIITDLGEHTFAKANGLGDLEALLDPAPIEIGNRVWLDADGDGIQDPGELPLSGVQVTLQSITGTIATATTDANGNYYFSSAAGTSTGSARYGIALAPSTNYTITVPTSVTAGAQTLHLTKPDVNSGAASTLRDSDANPATGLVAFTTGSPGATNHTYDFGFVPLAKLVVRKVGPQSTNCTTIVQAGQADPNLANNAGCATLNLNNGAAGQRFPFTDDVLTPNGIVSPTFTLAIGEAITLTNIISGAYNVTETVPAHWQLAGAVCSNGDAPTAVQLDDAALVTCTFTNTVIIKPEIVLKKYTNGYDADTVTGPYLQTGSVVTWTYVITNTGNVTLTNVTLTDDKLGGVACPVNSLAPAASTTCTKTGIAGVGQYTNTAVVTGTNSFTPTQQVTSTNPSHYFGANPGLVLKKYTNGYDADTLSDARPHLRLGDPVMWTYVITNTGNVTMSFAANSLKDDKEGTIPHVAFTLLPGASKTLTKQGTVTTVGVYANIGTIPGIPEPPLPGQPDLPTFPPVVPPTTPITDTDPSHLEAVGLSLGNRVWIDSGAGTAANRNNGRYDTGEPAAPQGIVVELLNITGTVLLTTTTDSNGYYRFDNLAVGSYQVRIPASAFAVGGKLYSYASSTGQTTTFAAVDNNRDHGDDAELNGVKSAVVTLGASNPTGEVDSGATGAASHGPSGDANDNLTVDFGFVPQATFGNFVWIESDSDGVASTGVITPVGGLVMTATDSTGTVYTTTTDANGYYTFSVPAAVYTVTYGSVPSSYGSVAPSATPNSGAADKNNPGTDQQSRPNKTVVTLVAGDNIPTIDFGFHAPRADLRLVKQANKTRVQHGDTLVYTLVLTNNGPDDAPAVKVTDQLPAGVTYQGAVAQQGTYDPNTGLWDVGTVTANTSVTLAITVTVK